MAKRRGNPDVDGVLIVDKPGGMSSFDVIRRLKPLLGTARIGHTGTLDPMATGVLVLCAGWSTRLVPYLSDGCKEYVGEIRLGVTTDTDDAEGRVVAEAPVSVDDADLDGAVAALTGAIEQVPPAYSAIKVDGQRAYAVARRGEEVELSSRRVEVRRFEVRREEDTLLSFVARVSKGTYVRSLARDLGAALGCGAHLASLRRTRNEPFGADEAVSLADVSGPGDLMAPFDALRTLPALMVTPSAADDLRQGRAIPLPEGAAPEAGVLYRLALPGSPPDLVALASVGDGALLHPTRVRPLPHGAG